MENIGGEDFSFEEEEAPIENDPTDNSQETDSSDNELSAGPSGQQAHRSGSRLSDESEDSDTLEGLDVEGSESNSEFEPYKKKRKPFIGEDGYISDSLISIEISERTILLRTYDRDGDVIKRTFESLDNPRLLEQIAKVRSFLIELEELSPMRISQITSLLKNTRAYDLNILSSFDSFTRESLENLFELLVPLKFEAKQMFPKALFTENIFKTVTGMWLQETDFDDEALLSLVKCNIFSCINDVLTTDGLNKFLHFWKQGDRRFAKCAISRSKCLFSLRDFQAILSDLNPNPIWSIDLYENSILTSILTKEECEKFKAHEYYSILRSDDIDDFLYIRLTPSVVEFCMPHHCLNNSEASQFFVDIYSAETNALIKSKIGQQIPHKSQ